MFVVIIFNSLHYALPSRGTVGGVGIYVTYVIYIIYLHICYKSAFSIVGLCTQHYECAAVTICATLAIIIIFITPDGS